MPLKLQTLGKIVSENWKLKALAMFLAIISYYMIRDATGYEVEYDVKIEVDAPGVAVLDKDPDVVRIRFRGTQDDILRLDQNKLKVTLRPRQDQPDGLPKVIPINRRDVERPPSVTIVKIDPVAVVLTFDREVTQTFTVEKPRTIGRPLVGNAELELIPQEVTLRGPQRRLEEMVREGRDRLTTEPVDVDGRVQSFTRYVKVLPPGGGWSAQIDPPEVQVRVTIATALVTREWPNLSVLAVRDPDAVGKLIMQPKRVDVYVKGPPETVEALALENLRIFVDCLGPDPSTTHERPVQVHLPMSMDLQVTTMPTTVSVTFTEN